MIFTQRLFTILLGLWFATILTDQASALYDPGVGRFCSRDPIGHTGSPKQLYGFLSDNPVAAVDPTGKITVKNQHVWGSCKTGGNASSYISADGNPNRPLDTSKAPCNGYLISKVTASCSKNKCPCTDGPGPTKRSELWLSAFWFNKGDRLHKGTAEYNAPALKGCAYFNFQIQFRFVCLVDLPQPVENSPGWGKVDSNAPEIKDGCYAPNGELVRKLDNGMTDPVLTVESSSGEKTGSASVEFDFCCCGKRDDYYLVRFNASDDDSGGIKEL